MEAVVSSEVEGRIHAWICGLGEGRDRPMPKVGGGKGRSGGRSGEGERERRCDGGGGVAGGVWAFDGAGRGGMRGWSGLREMVDEGVSFGVGGRGKDSSVVGEISPCSWPSEAWRGGAGGRSGEAGLGVPRSLDFRGMAGLSGSARLRGATVQDLR